MKRFTLANERLGFVDSNKLPSYEAVYEKLKQYEDLEEQGKLLKLPCSVGDIIWDIDFGRPTSYEVTGFSFGNLIEDYGEEEVSAFDEVIVHYSSTGGSVTGCFVVSEIGKTVFPSRKAAQEALIKELDEESQ